MIELTLFIKILLIGFVAIKAIHILFDKGMLLHFIPNFVGAAKKSIYESIYYQITEYEDFQTQADKADYLLKENRKYRLIEFMEKPVYACEYCMSSIWGSVVFYCVCLLDWAAYDMAAHLFYCLCLAGVLRAWDEFRERFVITE